MDIYIIFSYRYDGTVLIDPMCFSSKEEAEIYIDTTKNKLTNDWFIRNSTLDLPTTTC